MDPATGNDGYHLGICRWTTIHLLSTKLRTSEVCSTSQWYSIHFLMGYPRSIRPKNICIQWPFCLQKHKEFRQGATSQLMMLCNRTAVHDQLLQHGFHTTWHGGIRVSTVSSAAGATARVAVVVQTGCGFLSGGRKNATLDDKIFRTRSIYSTYLARRWCCPDTSGQTCPAGISSKLWPSEA